jgi:cell division protein FtsL
MQGKANKVDLQDEIRILRLQLGNLEVQIADYQQIVKELSDKLRLYEEINGSVFKASTK